MFRIADAAGAGAIAHPILHPDNHKSETLYIPNEKKTDNILDAVIGKLGPLQCA